MKLGSCDFTDDFSDIAADGPHIINCEDCDIDRVHLVTILLNDGQAFLVGIERAIDVRIFELDRLDVSSFGLGCVDVRDFVVAILVVEESDA